MWYEAYLFEICVGRHDPVAHYERGDQKRTERKGRGSNACCMDGGGASYTG